MAPVRLINNTYDQLSAAGGGIALSPARLPGSLRQAGWGVYRVNAARKEVVTDKDAAWYEYGLKCFYGKREEALAEAKRWVEHTYGEPGPWVRNARRDYVPARIQKQFPISRKGQD